MNHPSPVPETNPAAAKFSRQNGRYRSICSHFPMNTGEKMIRFGFGLGLTTALVIFAQTDQTPTTNSPAARTPPLPPLPPLPPPLALPASLPENTRSQAQSPPPARRLPA